MKHLLQFIAASCITSTGCATRYTGKILDDHSSSINDLDLNSKGGNYRVIEGKF